ncbi:hypothetical protein AAHA92_24832 [Salvia divinorum]|uniref:Uncharacterized protein n=1 Tax=Salvia divinorum TaxID=28513 RepID=A0ABD1G9C7_SALDI
MSKKTIPNLLMLKVLLGSDDDVARLLRRCSWFLIADLGKTLIPNVEILKRCNMPLDRILYFLYVLPRVFSVKSDIMMKSVDKAIESGVPHATYAFILAVGVFNHTSQEMWKVMLQTLRDLGFSDNVIITREYYTLHCPICK